MKERFRLRRSADFRKVFKEGKRFLSPHFVLYGHKNGQTRIGVSISKRHFKLATRRNRLRRIAKEVFRNELSTCFKGYDFIVASRRTCTDSNINKAIKELKYLMTKPRSTAPVKKV